MLKYIPMLISLVYVLNTALSYFYIGIPVLSNLTGMSILPWIFMYLSATVFRFCLSLSTMTMQNCLRTGLVMV